MMMALFCVTVAGKKIKGIESTHREPSAESRDKIRRKNRDIFLFFGLKGVPSLRASWCRLGEKSFFYFSGEKKLKWIFSLPVCMV